MSIKKTGIESCTYRVIRSRFAWAGILAGLGAAACATTSGQALAVQPVTLQLSPGQKAATLTVTNRGTSDTAVQTRAFTWNQNSGEDELVPSDEILVSPPIATIPPGGTQLVRLVLRRSPIERESTYRLLLDQIPPPAVSGTVRVVLRLSIPIFAQPMAATRPHVQFHCESEAGKMWLIGVNTGSGHEKLRDLSLLAKETLKLKTAASGSPYVLAGATRKWLMEVEGTPQVVGTELRLKAHGESGPIDEQITFDHLP